MAMLEWNEYHEQLKKRNVQIMHDSPEILRGYRTISNAGNSTNQLDAKTRELISIAVAVTLHCDGCIVVHTDAALKAGATEGEIVEALGVAITVNAGSALIFSGRVLDAAQSINSLKKDQSV